MLFKAQQLINDDCQCLTWTVAFPKFWKSHWFDKLFYHLLRVMHATISDHFLQTLFSLGFPQSSHLFLGSKMNSECIMCREQYFSATFAQQNVLTINNDFSCLTHNLGHCVYWKLCMGFHYFSPDSHKEIKPKFSQLCYFMYVVAHTKHEHCLRLFCQLCQSCIKNL